jgi:hypothetical protein
MSDVDLDPCSDTAQASLHCRPGHTRYLDMVDIMDHVYMVDIVDMIDMVNVMD